MNKKITNNTILKQGDKELQGFEIEGVVYWVDFTIAPYDGCSVIEDINGPGIFSPYEDRDIVENPRVIVAQSSNYLEKIPVVNLEVYLDNLAERYATNECEELYHSLGVTGAEWGWEVEVDFKKGYRANKNQYTQEDIERAIDLARREHIIGGWRLQEAEVVYSYTKEEILDQINYIKSITVDNTFNILRYE